MEWKIMGKKAEYFVNEFVIALGFIVVFGW